MMASIRKQPFGYWIVCGEIVPHEGEVETVRWIFDSFWRTEDTLESESFPLFLQRTCSMQYRPIAKSE